MAIKDKAVATLVSNRFLSNQSLGMSAIDSAVDTFETIINSLVDIIADRNEKIRVLEALALELGNQIDQEKIKEMNCSEYHHRDCNCLDTEALYQCTNGYNCGFPHTFKGPAYCPQCGFPAARVM